MMCRYTSIIYYYKTNAGTGEKLMDYIVLGYCEVQTCMTSVSGHITV